MELVELITQAPWREAVTYRETWPHEYVVIKKDKQEELFNAVCKRFCAGEGVDGKFFSMKNRYLFIGDYKYWLMTPCTEIDLEKDDYVLNRAPIYRDRRDFLIKDGDNERRDKEIDWIFNISPSRYYTGDEVPVKQVWMREDSDFTPWLAKNLPLLGEALGMNLELVQQEAEVGRFNVDILADDANNSVAVVIENQLEWTDHDHLGKILTYAGWHDARTLIWVTPRFYEEHRAALDWINRWTPEGIEVYGVELHTTEKSDSDANLEFVPVVYPKGWSKSGENRAKPVKIQSVVLREFFQTLVADLSSAGFLDDQKIVTKRDQSFPSGLTGINYHASFEGGRMVWVYISALRKNKSQIFKKPREERKAIESELKLASDAKTEIVWNTGAGNIGIWRYGSTYDSEEELDDIRKWMFDYLIKFKKVFNPRMERIINELQAADGE